MIKITEDDIAFAEKIFLNGSNKFSEEKKAIIKCLESKDIVACPGSGKTTTLLAKLSIIGKQLPYENNKGICVLTHTNVAIDEIKERLGTDSNKLFEYPNFFGTIQSFINQFLAIPYFRNTFKKNVGSIDDEIYHNDIIREFYSLEKGIRFGLNKKFEQRDMLYDFLKNMRFAFDDDILVDTSGKPLYKKPGNTSQALMELKREVMHKGVLCYDDAYWLSVQYLKKCGPQLRNFISERFSFLLIDEMQDTSHLQNQVLNQLFNKDKVIIQRFGDPNQSIYDDSDNMPWQVWEEPLKITDSKRNSEVISKVISPFELFTSGMNGNNELENINPKILVYDTESISQVLPEFAKIILENNLHHNSKNVFKAVGRIAKQSDNEKIKIPSYFPSFNQKSKSVETKKRYLADFHNKERIDHGQNKDVRSYMSSIINALLRVLWILKIKTSHESYFNKKTLINKILSDDNDLYLKFEENLIRWCLMIKKEEDIKQEFITFTNELLYEIFGVTDTTELDRFYNGKSGDEVSFTKAENVSRHYIDEDNSVEINIDTVAGVKGETHTATLFLETYYYVYDVQKLIGAFKGESKGKKGKREKSALKNAYVAMSRPTHLLCVAAQNSSIEGHEEELRSAGWDIVEIKSAINEQVVQGN